MSYKKWFELFRRTRDDLYAIARTEGNERAFKRKVRQVGIISRKLLEIGQELDRINRARHGV